MLHVECDGGEADGFAQNPRHALQGEHGTEIIGLGFALGGGEIGSVRSQSGWLRDDGMAVPALAWLWDKEQNMGAATLTILNLPESLLTVTVGGAAMLIDLLSLLDNWVSRKTKDQSRELFESVQAAQQQRAKGLRGSIISEQGRTSQAQSSILIQLRSVMVHIGRDQDVLCGRTTSLQWKGDRYVGSHSYYVLW